MYDASTEISPASYNLEHAVDKVFTVEGENCCESVRTAMRIDRCPENE